MVLQCARNWMENHLENSMKSHLDLSNLEISRLKRVRSVKESVCMHVLNFYYNTLNINRNNRDNKKLLF